LAREACGEAPQLEEYLGRFPQLAEPLRDQFEVHGVLESGRLLGSGPSIPPTHRPGDAGTMADPAEAPAVPGYEVFGELGRGGMGVVYKVWQASVGRMAALKVLRADSSAEPEYLARFRTEADAVARLQHPHIVQIYDVGQHAGRPYMVLEYVEGG